MGLIYTPRLLLRIWNVLCRAVPLSSDVTAATGTAFVQHYIAPSPASEFSWVDPETDATFLYDITVNQFQRTPPAPDREKDMKSRNDTLWRILPPALLEPRDDWMPLWANAVACGRLDEVQFLLEQGMDVNCILPNGLHPVGYAVGPWGGNIDLLRLLVEAGADLTIPGETDAVTLATECHKHISSAGEAQSAEEISSYLEQRTGLTPGSLSGRR